MLFLQRDLYEIILWRVPAFPQDAEGLGKRCVYSCRLASDISGIKDGVI